SNKLVVLHRAPSLRSRNHLSNEVRVRRASLPLRKDSPVARSKALHSIRIPLIYSDLGYTKTTNNSKSSLNLNVLLIKTLISSPKWAESSSLVAIGNAMAMVQSSVRNEFNCRILAIKETMMMTHEEERFAILEFSQIEISRLRTWPPYGDLGSTMVSGGLSVGYYSRSFACGVRFERQNIQPCLDIGSQICPLSKNERQQFDDLMLRLEKSGISEQKQAAKEMRIDPGLASISCPFCQGRTYHFCLLSSCKVLDGDETDLELQEDITATV
ncbi:hypothetical protein GIB67_001539, partial [Kingdonia uniflora]